MTKNLFEVDKTLDFLRGLKDTIIACPLSDDDKIKAYNKLSVALTLIKGMDKEIKSLMSTRMTHHEAIGYLNKAKFSGRDDWQLDPAWDGMVRGGKSLEGMSIGLAHALAKQIMEEKETENA